MSFREFYFQSPYNEKGQKLNNEDVSVKNKIKEQ